MHPQLRELVKLSAAAIVLDELTKAAKTDAGGGAKARTTNPVLDNIVLPSGIPAEAPAMPPLAGSVRIPTGIPPVNTPVAPTPPVDVWARLLAGR